MKCADCKFDYPDHFLNQMYANGKFTKPICGICALEVMNKAMGMRMTQFRGELAEQLRLDAIEHRKNYAKQERK
jgi:hypothetical protein